MCHIGTWSTRYCMRTAEKVWRSKVKKNMVCRVSKNDTWQITALPSVKKITLYKSQLRRMSEEALDKGLMAAAAR